MNVLYSVFYWLLSVFSALLWHDCLSVMHYDIMPYFTSRATGQTGGKMKCKCNAMQVVVLVVMVVTFYFMDFAMCRVLQLFKVCLFNDIVSNWYLALVVGEHRGRDLWLNDFNRVKTEVFGEKPVPLPLSVTGPTWNGLKLSLGLHSEASKWPPGSWRIMSCQKLIKQ